VTKESFNSLVGIKIAHLRAIKGFSQIQLAKKADISKSYVTQIETGFKQPTFRMIVKIAKALEIDWKELAIAPLSEKVEKLNIPNVDKKELNSILSQLASYL
jgi:transcriptional regulator with XRE-family HTH domain